ncbi:MAG TPA: HAD family hydrolase [Candidatus Binatus sp.]|nr:HAD family hydrolase [Candidatus Binatus sp.]
MKGVVFDWDGTLVDIDERELYSINQALAEHGLGAIDQEFFFQNYYRRAWELGTGPRMVIEAAFRGKDPRIVERAYETYRGIFSDTVDRVRLQAGAEDLLLQLKKNGFKVGVATMRYTRLTVERELNALGLDGVTDALYTRQDLGAQANPLESLEETVNKRARLVGKTLEHLGLDRSEAFLVGDSWWDIRAGKKIGLKTVVVKTGFSFHNDFTSEHPDFVVGSLDELLPGVRARGWL